MKKSKYAEKKARGRMMYGPGCCAHSLTKDQMWSIRRANFTTRPGNPVSRFYNPEAEDRAAFEEEAA